MGIRQTQLKQEVPQIQTKLSDAPVQNGATTDTYVRRLRAAGSISYSTEQREHAEGKQWLGRGFIQTELPDTSPTKSLVRLTRQNRRICTKYKPA
jgi:hypothetical protein